MLISAWRLGQWLKCDEPQKSFRRPLSEPTCVYPSLVSILHLYLSFILQHAVSLCRCHGSCRCSCRGSSRGRCSCSWRDGWGCRSRRPHSSRCRCHCWRCSNHCRCAPVSATFALSPISHSDTDCAVTPSVLPIGSVLAAACVYGRDSNGCMHCAVVVYACSHLA